MRTKALLPVIALLAAAACDDMTEPTAPDLQLEPAYASANASEKASDMPPCSSRLRSPPRVHWVSSPVDRRVSFGVRFRTVGFPPD